MSSNRLFTDEELKDMGTRTLDVLQKAIEEGDQKTAGELAVRMYIEFYAMHDLYRDWLTHTFSIIGDRYGDDVLSEVLKETVEGYTNRISGYYEGKSLKQKIKIMMTGLRGHLQPVEIEEDDDKIVIKPSPCGSGGRQNSDGMYDGPNAFHKMKGPAPFTFGRAEFPTYCAHCHAQNLVSVFSSDEAVAETVPSEKLGEEPCISYIYKK